MGIDFRRPRHIRGFRLGEVLVWDFTNKPLVKKTVSGNIVTFSDSADNTSLVKCEVTLAPKAKGRNSADKHDPIVAFSDSAEVCLKACKLTISPSVDGVSSIDVTSAGKNFLLPKNTDISVTTTNGIDISYSLANREFTLSGTNTKTDADWLILDEENFIINGIKIGETYRFSHNLTDDLYAQFTYNKSNGEVGVLGYLLGKKSRSASVLLTIPDDFVSFARFQIGVKSTADKIDIVAHFQFQINSTTSSYDPYITPTVHPATFGRVIYSGSVDVITGTGTIEGNIETVSNLSWTYDSKKTQFISDDLSEILKNVTSNATTLKGLFCPNYTTTKAASAPDMSIFATTKEQICIKDARYTDVETFLANMGNVKFVYPLNTPETFTFPCVPIVPKTGVNTMWSTEDISVEYYKEGYGYEKVKVYHVGKNILPSPNSEAWEEGGISNTSGKNINGSAYRRTIDYIPVRGGANTWLIISGYTNVGTPDQLCMFTYDAEFKFISYINESTKYAINEGVEYIRIRYSTANITFENPQMEYVFEESATATAYEPYTAPDEKIKDFSSIVYGGSYDFITGKGSVKYERAVYTGEASEAWAVTQASGIYRFYIRNDNVKAPENGRGVVYSSVGNYASSGYMVGTCYSSFSSSKVFIYYVPPQTVTTVEEFKVWLHGTPFDVVYEKAEPEVIESTPITILPRLGNNTLWNEQGGIEVTYYANAD